MLANEKRDMARPGVTEQEVLEAIETLREIGAKVTVESIRAELGRGRPNTINKYLRVWREKANRPVDPQTHLQVKQLKRRSLELEKELEVQRTQLQELSQLILERDQKILQLEKTLQAKEDAQSSLKEALQETQQTLDQIQAVEAAVTFERQALIEALTKAQQEQAEQFREDLKAINEMSLTQVREISMGAQDRWIEEKVKVRTLTLEIEQLKSLVRTLEQKVLAEQGANGPLRKRLKEQEKLIAACLDPQKLEAFNLDSKVEF